MSLDKIPEVTAAEFGVAVAKAMDKIQSSHCYFILQQAFPDLADDAEWSDFNQIIQHVLEAAKL